MLPAFQTHWCVAIKDMYFLEKNLNFYKKTKCDGDPLNFFKNVVSGKLTTLQWKAIYSRICGQYKLDLIGIFKRKKG